ncbi:MAG: type I DNA topoisomerase [Clostridia bacterium]|nr:type I DNA topoisomerase [Clostridia bacterium]
MSNLVIIESPTKAANLKSYLGSGYKVMASIGHVRDLPKSSLAVNTEHGFTPHFINIRGKGDLIKELQKEAKKASTVYLATDPDREGEAIAWHLSAALKLDPAKTKRITFNEVTKPAVKAAIRHPRAIDMNLVNSQMARRILDRIVGYKLSPYLWKTVRSGISAGRVQSVATRIIVEREEEIKNFVPKEYWTITATLKNSEGILFTARYYGKNGRKSELGDEESAMKVVSATASAPFEVVSIKKALKTRQPAPPFTTSTLQQDANRKLGFSSSRTMKVAQELYEGVNLGAANGGVSGLITYMRTDSVRVSDEAYRSATDYIRTAFGAEYLPRERRHFKTKTGAQDAHEAIRPVNPALHPDRIKAQLSADQYKLYKLIWARFIASQMAAAGYDTVQADLDCASLRFKAAGSQIRFQGYLSVYEDAPEGEIDTAEGLLPELREKERLLAEKVHPDRHFTEPPARFNEGSLVKFLEEKGIGRPSTFAAIVTTIIQRGYVRHEGKSLVPTELGVVTTRLMIENFPDVVDYGFTAQMEERLDDIAAGGKDMTAILEDFYTPFEKSLTEAMEKADRRTVSIEPERTDIVCDKCGALMIIKNGRFGKFAACPNYPDCKNTKPLDKDGKTEKEQTPVQPVEGMTCEKCGGQMVLRSGRYGSFYACINYPKCTYTKQTQNKIGVPCPLCGKDLVSKRGRNKTLFYSCSGYPECSFSSWDLPTNERCPVCGDMLLIKKGKNVYVCRNKDCAYTAPCEQEQRKRPEDEQ